MYTNWCRYKWVNTTLALSTGPEHLFTLLAERPCQWPSWPTGREQKLLSPGINLWGEVISPRVPRRIHQPRETKDSTCGQNPYGSQSQSQEEPVDIKSRWRHNWKSAQVVNSHLVYDPTIWQPGFDLPRQQWSMLNRFRTKQGHCGACRRNGDLQTLICVLVARPRRCLTLSNPVPWQNWMAAYLGYTLCRWRRCFVADQLWLMKRIREESLLLADVRNFVFFCTNRMQTKKYKKAKLQMSRDWCQLTGGRSFCSLSVKRQGLFQTLHRSCQPADSLLTLSADNVKSRPTGSKDPGHVRADSSCQKCAVNNWQRIALCELTLYCNAAAAASSYSIIYAPLIRLRHRALYKFVWLIDCRWPWTSKSTT